MSSRARRLLAFLTGVLLLAACEAETALRIDVEEDGDGTSQRITFGFPGAQGTSFYEALPNFLLAQDISAQTLFSTMNFTVFGPQPSA